MDRRDFVKGVGALVLLPTGWGIMDCNGSTWTQDPATKNFEGTVFLYGRVQMPPSALAATSEQIGMWLDTEAQALKRDFISMVENARNGNHNWYIHKQEYGLTADDATRIHQEWKKKFS